MQLRSKKLKRDFELTQGSTIIGRNPTCDILLESKETSISRRHAEIRVQGGTTEVRDLGSRNGTFLNHQPLIPSQWQVVDSGDTLTICEFDFEFFAAWKPVISQGSCLVVSSSVMEFNDTSSLSFDSGLERIAEPHDRSDQLKALLKVTECLRGELQAVKVLSRTTEILLDIFPAVERAAIGFFDESGLLVPSWWHLREQDAAAEIRISQTVVEYVESIAEAVLTNDAGDRFPDAESVHALELRSIMCAPLINTEGKVSGILHVDARQPGRFNSLDLQVLATVATQISQAIEYCRLHEQFVRDRILVHDLQRARDVQQQYLPKSIPTFPGYEIAAFYRAARAVGGDYYDFIPLSDGRLALVLADVEGKGAPAALSMVKLATETHAGAEICDSAAKLVTRLNARMSAWVTYVAIYFDFETHRLEIANAGHEYPLLLRPTGSVDELTHTTSGTPLSVFDNYEYKQESIYMCPGEMLVLMSDGFADADTAQSSERFGKHRILEALLNYEGNAEDFVSRLIKRVDEFRQGCEQFDDMCLICLKRVG